MNQPTTPALPEYVCHKRVQAARISGILPPEISGSRMHVLYLTVGEDMPSVRQAVPQEYIERYKPEIGGWFVRGGAGQAVYMGAKAFEETYSRVPEPQPDTPEQTRDREFCSGAQWSDAELSQMRAFQPQAMIFKADTVVLKDSAGRIVAQHRPATPAELTVAALTGQLPPGTYDPEDPKYGRRPS